MKKYLLSVLTLGVIFSFVSAATFAQTKPRVLGGYKEVSKTSAEVRAAADFAVEAQGEKDGAAYRLEAIEKAETQTVAGTNFRLCLHIVTENEEAEEEISGVYQVVVFRNLQKEFTLKSWAESDCAGKK